MDILDSPSSTSSRYLINIFYLMDSLVNYVFSFQNGQRKVRGGPNILGLLPCDPTLPIKFSLAACGPDVSPSHVFCCIFSQ